MRHQNAGFRCPMLCQAALLKGSVLPGNQHPHLGEMDGEAGACVNLWTQLNHPQLFPGRGGRDAEGLNKCRESCVHCHMSMKSLPLLPCINCNSLRKCSRKAVQAGNCCCLLPALLLTPSTTASTPHQLPNESVPAALTGRLIKVCKALQIYSDEISQDI